MNNVRLNLQSTNGVTFSAGTGGTLRCSPARRSTRGCTNSVDERHQRAVLPAGASPAPPARWTSAAERRQRFGGAIPNGFAGTLTQLERLPGIDRLQHRSGASPRRPGCQARLPGSTYISHLIEPVGRRAAAGPDERRSGRSSAPARSRRARRRAAAPARPRRRTAASRSPTRDRSPRRRHRHRHRHRHRRRPHLRHHPRRRPRRHLRPRTPPEPTPAPLTRAVASARTRSCTGARAGTAADRGSAAARRRRGAGRHRQTPTTVVAEAGVDLTKAADLGRGSPLRGSAADVFRARSSVASLAEPSADVDGDYFQLSIFDYLVRRLTRRGR